MNREIKFRAWDGKELSNPFTFRDFSGDERDEVFIEDVMSYPCLYLDENLILMQYTGLKDKNGKEIYEGDLIREEDGSVKEIYWDTDLAGFHTADKEEVSTPFGIPEYDEVIGNIYKNPELLNPNH